VGAFSSASALMEMVKGKTLEEAEKITEEDIINFLGGIPKQKIHCTCLAKRTLQRAVEKYRKTKTSAHQS
jgi:NifU-like protein